MSPSEAKRWAPDKQSPQRISEKFWLWFLHFDKKMKKKYFTNSYGEFNPEKLKDLTGWPELCNNQYQSNQGGFMNEQQNKTERLWDYIDGMGTEEEKSAVEKLIASNMDWQNSYHELLEVHQIVQNSELDAPSLRFTKNVMEEIAKYQVAPATKNYINKKIIWGIGGFFIVMVLGFLIYGFSQITWSGTNSAFTFSQIDLGKLDWSKFFNNAYTNIFVMVNTVLGLILLDMYLQRKKDQRNQKQA